MSDPSNNPIPLYDNGPMGSCRHDEWANLVGLTVEVRKDGQMVRIGVIEDATLDRSHIWIAQEGTTGRELFDKGSGYQVWIPPIHLQHRERLIRGEQTNRLSNS